MHACAPVGNRDLPWALFLRHRLSCLFETGSVIGIRDFPIRPDWLAREPQGSSCFYLTSTGIYRHGSPTMPASFWMGIEPRASCMLGKHSSPEPFPQSNYYKILSFYAGVIDKMSYFVCLCNTQVGKSQIKHNGIY